MPCSRQPGPSCGTSHTGCQHSTHHCTTGLRPAHRRVTQSHPHNSLATTASQICTSQLPLRLCEVKTNRERSSNAVLGFAMNGRHARKRGPRTRPRRVFCDNMPSFCFLLTHRRGSFVGVGTILGLVRFPRRLVRHSLSDQASVRPIYGFHDVGSRDNPTTSRGQCPKKWEQNM